MMDFKAFYTKHKYAIWVSLLLITLEGIGLSFIWGSATQLDLISCPAVMKNYSPTDMWYFPFKGNFFGVAWTVYDAYVRMFWGIAIGVIILLFGMFILGWEFGKEYGI